MNLHEGDNDDTFRAILYVSASLLYLDNKDNINDNLIMARKRMELETLERC